MLLLQKVSRLLSRIMKLNILVCTTVKRIADVAGLLLPQRCDVSYIVSVQYDGEALPSVSVPELKREDVAVHFLRGFGLCRNRNNALRLADGDIALIADDDLRYKTEYFDTVLRVFEENKGLDVALFKMTCDIGGKEHKPYPGKCTDFPVKGCRGYFPSSAEMAFRVASVKGRVCFDERFGLGAEKLNCGEEDIFLKDCIDAGLTVRFFPHVVTEHYGASTGGSLYSNDANILSRGATAYYLHGCGAYPRALKFALSSSLSGKASFFPTLDKMLEGIRYERSSRVTKRIPGQPLFGIVIPVKNRREFIGRVLSSVLAQKYRPLQLVIVDNGSDDGSLLVAEMFKREYSADDFEVIVGEERKPGACAARNRGAELCSAEYLMFFDDDDSMSQDTVSRIMQCFLREHPDIVGFRARYEFADGKRRNKKYCFSSSVADQIVHCMLATQCFAVRRDFFIRSGGWDDMIMRWQDWNLGIRMLLKSPKVAWIKHPVLITVYPHEESISGNGFLHSEQALAESIVRSADAVAGSDLPNREKYAALVYSRAVILAAHYMREGDSAAAERGLRLFFDNVRPGRFVRFFALSVFRYTAAGGRGGGSFFRFILK